jgi:uncharacterized membrane protein YtjA (UPF0391 family)
MQQGDQAVSANCLIQSILKCSSKKEVRAMLQWTLIFLVVAIIAAVFGFGGVAGTAAGIAKILFFIFLVLFIISLIFGRSRV